MASTQLQTKGAQTDSRHPRVAAQQFRWLAIGLVLGFHDTDIFLPPHQ